MLDRALAEILISRCTGDEIWSEELCRELGVPEPWIDDLSDCYESGFDRDSNTIYSGDRVTNQYHGLRDIDIAFLAAEYLGIDVQLIRSLPLSRRGQVEKLKAELDEV